MKQAAHLLSCFILALFPAAQVAGETSQSATKVWVDGAVVVFDTESGQQDSEIELEDVTLLRDALRSHPTVTTLRLNSSGGSIYAAEELSRVVSDFELDTEVDGRCTSSCVTVFLAGERRSMTRGSAIGFHARWWSPEDIQTYYEDNKDDEGWTTPFALASWIYEDTQAEIHRALVYVISRGVDPRFAVEMHAPREQMWYPSRAELEAAGILKP